MDTPRTVSLSDLSPQKSPEASVLSPALFTLHTDDCRSTDPDMLTVKYSDDTVILDAFKRLPSAVGALASRRKKQSPPSESIQNKRNGYRLLCNLTPPMNLTADRQAIEQVDKCGHLSNRTGHGLHF